MYVKVLQCGISKIQTLYMHLCVGVCVCVCVWREHICFSVCVCVCLSLWSVVCGGVIPCVRLLLHRLRRRGIQVHSSISKKDTETRERHTTIIRDEGGDRGRHRQATDKQIEETQGKFVRRI